jgi:hypothetical protein
MLNPVQNVTYTKLYKRTYSKKFKSINISHLEMDLCEFMENWTWHMYIYAFYYMLQIKIIYNFLKKVFKAILPISDGKNLKILE